MGEWSEYFEDFPEENPANWVNGRFDPKAAADVHAANARAEKVAEESRELMAKLQRIAQDARRNAKERCPPNGGGDIPKP